VTLEYNIFFGVMSLSAFGMIVMLAS
jgi:hypothetical protein